jgi:hypothetical protein
MTTFDLPTDRTHVDDLLARLRTGGQLTTTQRASLAELLATVRRCHVIAQTPEHDSDGARAGLFARVLQRFDDEFGPAARGMCGVYRALHQPSVCGHPDADHPLCGCCPDTCDCPEQTRS